MLRRFYKLDNWTKLVVFFMWGSLFLGKASAYVGLALGGLLLINPRVFWNRWYVALTRRADPMSAVSWALLVSLLYGICELIYGILVGYSVVTALQILCFNIAPVALFLGIWVGFRHPMIVRHYFRFVAWFSVIYAPIYFLFLSKLNLEFSGPLAKLSLISSPGSGSAALIGLLCYEPNLAQFWLPILGLTCLTLVNQERSDWLGLGVTLSIWGYLSKRMSRVLGIVGTIAIVLGVAALVDLRLPAIPGRGGELSARETVARMAGSISPEMSEAVGGSRENAQYYYGTVHWRQHWWEAIRNEVAKQYGTMIFGLGYGYPLGRLAGKEVQQEGTRTPHDILYFAYGYSGLVGVAIFLWLEVCLFLVLWRVYKTTGQMFGLAYFAYQMINALFGNTIEAPQAGIFFYLVMGLTIGPMFLKPLPAPRVESTGRFREAFAESPFPEVMVHARGE